MARNNTPINDGDTDFPSRAGVRAYEDLDNVRGGEAIDSISFQYPDSEEEQPSPFLRKQKRVPARKGPLPKKTAKRVKVVIYVLLVLGTAAGAYAVVNRYLFHASRFRIESSDQIEVVGNEHVSKSQVMEVFGGDISRNIFMVPLEARKQQLEQIPWVESATLMRFLPNRLKVEITERTPVAYVLLGNRIALIDANGVVMEKPAGAKFSFTVITGMAESEPLSTRAPRMKIFNALMRDLDSEGAHYSQDLEEVSLSDPEDVVILAKDQLGGVYVHLGSSDFLERYKVFIANVARWRQVHTDLREVDLRYKGQFVVNPGGPAAQAAPPPAPPAATPAAKPTAKPTPSKKVAAKAKPVGRRKDSR